MADQLEVGEHTHFPSPQVFALLDLIQWLNYGLWR